MKNADRGKNRYIVLVLTVLLFIVLLIWVLFRNLIGNYETNTAAESADHLIELNYQIKLYIEEKINSDWQVAHSVANILESSPLDEDRLLSLVRSEMALWDVSDITLFAKNGRVMSVSGEHKPNDVASEIIYRTREQGEYLSIMQSSMTYSIPLNTEAMLGDSQIAALSLVQDLSSFLDHMEFSSFDGSAFMYLTQDNGVVISRLTHQDASDVYNIMSLFRGTEMTCLHGDAHEYEKEILMFDTAPYTMHNEKGKYYVVSTPVVANRANLRLFYIVPEEIVNHTMTTFSGYVTLLCVMVITVFAAVAIIISFAFYL